MAVWIAAPVVSAVQHALETHACCAEHGALEEVAGATHDAPSVAHANSGITVRRGDHSQSEPGHETCALQAFAPGNVSAPDAAVAVAPAPLSAPPVRSIAVA
jgi:hypothetical protein